MSGLGSVGLSGVLAAISGARSAIVSGLVATGLCLPVGYCTGFKSASARYEARQSLARTKAMELDAHARDKADRSRSADVLSIDKHEEELVNAIAQVPDDKPDAVRVALGCQRLRGQGAPESGLPAICRP